MALSFHTRTVLTLAAAATLLGSGLLVARHQQRRLDALHQQQAELSQLRQMLATQQDRTETYATLIERIGWRPGQALRHESIDTTATIARDERDRLNEILQASHVGQGQFFLRSLRIESLTSKGSQPQALKISVKGDNILVLDRP